jgi:hypothetical protein
MFMFDVETLGVESDSVILSMACIHFDPRTNPTYKELKESALFIKLDVKDQATRLNRRISKDTIAWWDKQCLNARTMSLIPSPTDVPVEEGLDTLRTWASSKKDNKSYVWSRGSLDGVMLHSIEHRVGTEPIFPYPRWRDVRTAIDFLTGSTNGYCTVDHPEFNYDVDVTKHNPIDDCALDIMMLIYGKSKIT